MKVLVYNFSQFKLENAEETFTEKNIILQKKMYIYIIANMPFNSEGLKTDVNAAHFSTFGLTQTIGNQKWKYQMYNKI